MSLLKTNEIQNYNGSSLTLTASTVSTSAQLNTGGNISVTGSLNVSDDSTTRTNLGLGTIATQDSDSITVTGGSVTGTEIDLKSSGTSIFKSDGTTAVLSESGGAVTLGNSTLADTVSFTDKYYLQGKIQSNFTTFENNSQINFDGSTAPYWTFTGDTTNFVQGTESSDLKIIKSGIYLIIVNINASLPSPDSERFFNVIIRGVGSESTTVISEGLGQVINADVGTSRNSATASAIRNFNADDQINIYVESVSDGNIDLLATSHFSMCLIRPL